MLVRGSCPGIESGQGKKKLARDKKLSLKKLSVCKKIKFIQTKREIEGMDSLH